VDSYIAKSLGSVKRGRWHGKRNISTLVNPTKVEERAYKVGGRTTFSHSPTKYLYLLLSTVMKFSPTKYLHLSKVMKFSGNYKQLVLQINKQMTHSHVSPAIEKA
jgi:hypothetical protein